MRAVSERGDPYAQAHNLEMLEPIKHFLEAKKRKRCLTLSDDDKVMLANLVNRCTGVKVSFDYDGLNYLEILDLAISSFLNTSSDRAKILCTTAGSLRNISMSIYKKLKANNRFHAMLIATRKGIIKIL